MSALASAASLAALALLGASLTASVGAQPRPAAPRDTTPRDTTARESAPVVVTATRGERRVEDSPIRVEVIDEEEIAEKVAMTPGDIAMMLNETGGLRVQTTSPSLGGANVRVQGLRGRYTQLLADGLPLYGAQTGGLGLLQIPPVDLGRVEIVKGTASALYGSAALGGVINLVSRRPTDEPERTVLANGTTRGGADLVGYAAGALGGRGSAGEREGERERSAWGYTLLAGLHGQRRNDLDADGWTDMPGYRRAVVRPRLFHDAPGRSAFLTAGLTLEDRDGGTLAGRTAPDGRPFAEALATRRADVGALGRWVLGGESPLAGTILTARGSAMTQAHAHTFGPARERDRHATAFVEASLTRAAGRATTVLGAAWQRERYVARDVAGFDFDFSVPAAFAQVDVDAASWLALSTSARLDAHDTYGTVASPRVSALVRRPAAAALAGWNARLSAGTGFFAPTPFTEETEVVGLRAIRPLRGLVAERARSASVDVGGPLETALGRVELYGSVFGATVRRPVQLRTVGDDPPPGTTLPLVLANAPGPVRSGGAELLARLVRELGGERALRVTATYTHLRASECMPVNAGVLVDPAPCPRRELPLTPRHAAGLVGSVEAEDAWRVGVELYHTGRQALEENPFRATSRPYTVLGVLAERVVETPAGRARLFVNLENLTDVRQTRVDPLVRRAPGPGGRWTTDVWSPLEGRVINGGVRFTR